MKRINNLYDKLLDKNYIKTTIIKASKGKRRRKEVIKVLNNIDYYTDRIYEMVESGEYILLPTHNKTITEKGKKRELTISPFFPNRILDYLMTETLKPYIRKSMYKYCIGNVDKRGIIYGKKIIARKYKHYKYHIKLDINKFYPSVSSSNLYDFIESKIKDKKFLILCKTLILSEKDLPIGSYYSQWFSNWYLEDIDHYIKEILQIPFYIRYVDDMLLMGNNKRVLKRAMYHINKKLHSKYLKLKRFEIVSNINDKPIDFIGFRFCKDLIRMRIRNFKRLNIKIKKIRKYPHISVLQARSILSYIGWLK